MRDFVTALERAVIELAAAVRHRAPSAAAARRACTSRARKLASVGVRVRRQGSYHGLALNVALDLAPFARINPCGYAGSSDDAARPRSAARPRWPPPPQRLKPHLLRALWVFAHNQSVTCRRLTADPARG